MASAATSINDRQWYIVGRWQEYEGEARTNLLRIIAIGAFYAVQLVHFYWISQADPSELPFQQRATAIAVAWTMVALAILLCLRLKMFPAALKYVTATCDVLLLTALASLGDGPTSPLVLGYFLIIAAAALRFSLGLVWFSTLASMFGYLSLVGLKDKTWFDNNHAVPPVTQLLTLLCLALTGIVIGQVVRRVRALATDYAERLAAARGKS